MAPTYMNRKKDSIESDGQRKFFNAKISCIYARGSVVLEAQDFERHGRV